MPVLLLGSIALDSISTPDISVKNVLGGSASYAAYAINLFAKPHLLSVVGEDFRDSYLSVFEKSKFDLLGLQVRQGNTFYWEAQYIDNFRKRVTTCTELNVFADFEPVVPPAYTSLSHVFLANICPELQLSVLEKVKKPLFTMVDTMPLWIDTKKDKVLEVFSKVNAVIINDEEAQMLFDTPYLKVAAGKILDMGPQWVILKKGEHGSFLMGRSGEIFLLPAYPVDNLIDPTGAGDSFAGALIGYLSGMSRIDFNALKQAMVWGTVTASFAIEDFSVRSLEKLDNEQLDARRREFYSYLHIDSAV